MSSTRQFTQPISPGSLPQSARQLELPVVSRPAAPKT
ncbi:MAG TPA: hypothetical protein EYN66_02785, partial [Myxococcales bacterium]|nr:hypothetical protein [Myxococcales bacterium]